MKIQRTKRYLSLTTLPLCVLYGGLSLPALAAAPGQHPHYLHALASLRSARALIIATDKRHVVTDERNAVTEIDQAIAEIKKVASEDSKSTDAQLPVDSKLPRLERLRRARKLLDNARHDLTSVKEDDQAALGWRQRAIGDTDDASKAVQKAASDEFYDDHTPIPGADRWYAKAIADMRLARALLSNAGRDKNSVMADERSAALCLTDAIVQAKIGAADDGQSVEANPPIDKNMSHKDRVAQALKLELDTKDRLTRDHRAAGVSAGILAKTVTQLNRAIAATQKAAGDRSVQQESTQWYIRAINDMRYARALLNNTDATEGDVMQDQRSAALSLTDAIIQAKLAAVDDKQSLPPIPQIEKSTPRSDRLAQALKIQLDCQDRLMHTRTPAGKEAGILASTLKQLNRAIAATQKAVSDDKIGDAKVKNKPLR